MRYVVPHKLDKSTLEAEDVRLQMRVTRPIEQPVWVEVHDGENLITRKAERYVRPGEMVTVVLKTKNYADVSKASKLTIDINPR